MEAIWHRLTTVEQRAREMEAARHPHGNPYNGGGGGGVGDMPDFSKDFAPMQSLNYGRE